MKKDNSPLIVAVFLVIGGLLSGASVFNNGTKAAEVISTHRNSELLISTAQGAENAATLFGARTLSPVVAVPDNGAPDPKSIFSPTLGAIKDPDVPFQNSSLSR